MSGWSRVAAFFGIGLEERVTAAWEERERERAEAQTRANKAFPASYCWRDGKQVVSVGYGRPRHRQEIDTAAEFSRFGEAVRAMRPVREQPWLDTRRRN